jgi:DNA polymerase
VAYYRGKVAVYDIANAGPNHRFTVSDTLVHNCLALGFLGGVGAYKAMARGYGMRVTDEEGKIIVDGWRERNRWAHRFGVQIEAAAFSALENPHRRYKAGRIEYEFLPNLMKGTLICWLPDGRPLVYPMVKVETQMKFDKPTKVITYMNGMARNSTWRGKLLENAVQSVAAGLLRGAILRLDQEETQAGVVFHTHDEIGGEVDEAEAWPFADRLVETMVRGYDWSEGLPLAAEVEVSYYYTKDEKAAMKRPS